ncbi:protein-tyrosine sulfotransferase-like isoform X3 [Musa acuminata AAA Group]|uniref:protein-tyrosine sulfotransferase-like isoform X3 n=1 Tax=Musa acuminata AAA Group TaxID=214697 RepID=UPI0031D7E220
MSFIYNYHMLIIVLSLASTLLLVSCGQDDYFHCESVVRNWAEYSSEDKTKEGELTLKDLLFFLHVPRTGGRTYFHWKPNCSLMVTHDDYSLLSKLPKDRTSVVTIFRDPVDRVFSTYEFSVEVAARFLGHPNLTSATKMSGQIRRKSRGVSTLDIWPWKYLVPWMSQDLFARQNGVQRDTRELGRPRKIKEITNPYDVEEIVMPLHEFINDPMAHEIIHNGATFQVAGLTNNSYTVDSHDVRNCVQKHPELGHFILEVAKRRLNHMLYVGLTEEHKKSATMFAKLVGAQVLSQSEALNSDFKQAISNKTEPTSFPDPKAKGSNQFAMSVGTLMEIYESCISTLRKSQASRRTMSLKRVAPVNFSKQARVSVPMTVLQQIQYLNNLDVELYKHAQNIFMLQQKHLMQNAEDIFVQPDGDLMAEVEPQKAASGSFYRCLPWRLFLAIALLMIIVLIVLATTTSRRTEKLKI